MITRHRILIKKSIIGLIFYFLLISTGLLRLFLSRMNNFHEKENYILDTLSGHGRNRSGALRPKRWMVGDAAECEETPKHLIGQLSIADAPPDLKITELVNSELQDGSYEPTSCKSRYRVAIIIPLRGREKNLRHMLSHMHPIWRRQEFSYTVFVITQAGWDTFNKAKLMNAGFKEANLHGHYDCFVFHDVDALLEDDRCLYWCNQDNPRHLCAYADVFHYKDIWYYSVCRYPRDYFTSTKLFGGVTMFTSRQFLRINGFSNYYWGWGGEDDDMYVRLKNKGYEVMNPYGKQCSYTLLQHPHENENAPASVRDSLLYHGAARQDCEGLSSLRYRVLSYQYQPLFVNITVDVGKPSKRMQEFLDHLPGISLYFTRCILRMPWNF